jgi:hypothetical protein
MAVARFLFFFIAAACLAGTGGVFLLRTYQAWRPPRNPRQPFASLERIAEASEDSDRETLDRLMEVIDEWNKKLDPDYASTQHR